MVIMGKYNEILDGLVFAIGNTHYDITAIVLNKIADNITKKAYETNSSKLKDISNCVYEAKQHIDNAWEICKDKMDCSKHPRNVVGYTGTIDELAQYICNDYDKRLWSFLDKQGDDFLRQADADWTRGEKGRKKLATQLYAAANALYKTKFEA